MTQYVTMFPVVIIALVSKDLLVSVKNHVLLQTSVIRWHVVYMLIVPLMKRNMPNVFVILDLNLILIQCLDAKESAKPVSFLSVPNVVIPMNASLALMNVLTTLIASTIREATTANVKLEELVTDSKQVSEL